MSIKRKFGAGDVVIYLVMLFVCFITLYPMYYVFILSISDPVAAAGMKGYFWPKGRRQARLWAPFRWVS